MIENIFKRSNEINRSINREKQYVDRIMYTSIIILIISWSFIYELNFFFSFCFMRTCAGAIRNIISVASFFLVAYSLFQYGLLQPTHTSILISTPEREENIENCNPSQYRKWHVSAFFCCSTIVDKQNARKRKKDEGERY
jgi:hypothetical protein